MSSSTRSDVRHSQGERERRRRRLERIAFEGAAYATLMHLPASSFLASGDGPMVVDRDVRYVIYLQYELVVECD
jgi:hypothetical protein